MQFKDIQQGCAVYILNKQDMTVTEGKVNPKSFPYMKTINGITQMVLDVGIEAAGKTATYAIPENLMATYAGDLVVTTERKNLIPEVKRVMNEAEKLLASKDRLETIVKKSRVFLPELDPVFKERQETEERFGKMESTISELKELILKQQGTINDFVRKFDS